MVYSHGLGIWFTHNLPSLLLRLLQSGGTWGPSPWSEMRSPSRNVLLMMRSWSEGMWPTDLLPAGAFVSSVKSLIWIKAALKLQQQHFIEGFCWTRCLFGAVKWQWREEKLGDVLCWGITMPNCLINKILLLFLLNISTLQDSRLGGALQQWPPEAYVELVLGWPWGHLNCCVMFLVFKMRLMAKAIMRWQAPGCWAKWKNCNRHLIHWWY